MRALVLAGALLLLSGACKKDEPASGRPAPMSAAERKRGTDACQSYVDRLCGCAKSKASKELQDRCELQGGRVQTIETVLSVELGADVTPMDVLQAQDAARKVIAQCVHDMGSLDQAGCP